MTARDGYALLAILLCVVLNAFFTLAGAALVTVRAVRLQQIIAEGGQQADAAAGVQELIRHPTRIVATVQVGITLTAFAIAAIAASVLAPHFADTLHVWGIAHDRRVATVALTLIFALFTISVGEIVPRSIALRSPERVALLVQAPLRFCAALLSPLAVTALGVSNLLVKPFGLSATFARPLITEEELRTLLEASAQAGAIEEDEKQIIRNVISFGDTDARQVMTPRIDIQATPVEMPLPEFLDLVVKSGHSRIPVYEGSVDAIIGIVHAKDLLPGLARGERAVNLRAIMRAPLLVSENKRVDGLLDEFRRSNTQMAIVQDEYGGTAGLVTLEDLLEELVGEINDEYDLEEPSVRVIDSETSVVDGRMAIDDINEQMGLSLPCEDYDTIGGYVFGLFGRQPNAGESVESEDAQFVIEKTDGRRIQQVRLCKRPARESSPAESGEARTGA